MWLVGCLVQQRKEVLLYVAVMQTSEGCLVQVEVLLCMWLALMQTSEGAAPCTTDRETVSNNNSMFWQCFGVERSVVAPTVSCPQAPQTTRATKSRTPWYKQTADKEPGTPREPFRFQIDH